VILRYYAGEACTAWASAASAMNAKTLVFTTRVPVGVVGMITPWNFPVAIPIWKAAPALIYGNTVVLKPAGLAPLVATLIAECFCGSGTATRRFSISCTVRDAKSARRSSIILSSTPSASPVRARWANESRNRVPRVARSNQLEMGGKNPIICLEDADLAQAVRPHHQRRDAQRGS